MDVQEYNTLLAAYETQKPLGDWTNKPAVPATTVPATNTTQFKMRVELTVNGATITNVKVDGVIIGGGTPRTSGSFGVRPRSTISITYTAGAPTWQWFYE